MIPSAANSIKYRFKILRSDTTGFCHVVFDCILAAGKLTPKLQKLLPAVGDPDAVFYYNHNGDWQNTIVLETIESSFLWNTYILPFIWIEKETNRTYFLMHVDGELIKPDTCIVCGDKNPSITETVVQNGRAVKQNKYCSIHSDSYMDLLIMAAHDG